MANGGGPLEYARGENTNRHRAVLAVALVSGRFRVGGTARTEYRVSGKPDSTGGQTVTTTETTTLTREDDGWWVATDEVTGAVSQGETRVEALENLDAAIALVEGSIGREPTADELQSAGVDPETNATDYGDLPEVLRE